MSASEIDGQIELLRELWLTDGDLTFLRELAPAALARIVAEVRAHNERVSGGQRTLYETMARATRFIPNFVIVKLASNLSPYVQARICEYLEPKSAAALSKSYEPAMLAEISLHLDPQLTARIAAHSDVDALVKITELLASRGLGRRLGEVSDALDLAMLERLVLRITSPQQIAAVAANMRDHDKLARVSRKLDPQLLRSVLALLAQQGQHGTAQVMAR